MKKIIKASSDLSNLERIGAKILYKRAADLLDAFDDLSADTIDKLGDMGVIYQDLLEVLPGLHYQIYGDDYAE